MAIPTVTSLTPATGLSLGDELVEIVGTGFNLAAAGTVRVFFDDLPAPSVGVASATLLLVRTPRAAPGAVTVRVENVTPDPPDPDVVESVEVEAGFEFKRTDLSTPSAAAYPAIEAVTNALLRELQTHVVENAKGGVSPEAPDLASLLDKEEAQHKGLGLKLSRGRSSDDREYALNGPQAVATGGGGYNVFSPGEALKIEWDVVGFGRTSGEANALHAAWTTFLKRTTSLDVPDDPEDPDSPVASIRLEPVWDARGETVGAVTRQGVWQWRARVRVRGVEIGRHKIWRSRDVDTIGLTIVPLVEE